MTARALLVGVGAPTVPGMTFPTLDGVQNDVTAMAEMLGTRGVSQVTTAITPEETTAYAVLTGLRALVTATAPGDTFVFYFSGHGEQLPAIAGDEPDKKDEVLAVSNCVIRDDDVRQVWDGEKEGEYRGVQPGAHGVIVVDACHGETAAYKGADGVLLPGPLVTPGRTAGAVEVDLDADARLADPVLDARVRVPPRRLLWLAACADAKDAVEASFDGVTRGVFTEALTRVLRTEAPGSYADLMRRVRALLVPTYPAPRTVAEDPGGVLLAGVPPFGPFAPGR